MIAILYLKKSKMAKKCFNFALMKRLLIILIMCIPFIMDAQTTMSVLNHSHQVNKGETLLTIAQQYNITEQALLTANTEISKNGKLKKGTYLIIPQPVIAQKTEEAVPEVVTPQKPSTIKVGVILPFEEKTERGKKMVEFYQGFLMAADSIKKEGLNLDIYTFNSGSTEAEIMEILMKPEMSTLHMLFGPVDEQQLPATISFCKIHNIRLVLPFTNGQSTIENPHLYLACPNNTVTITEAAALVSRAYSDKNFIILKSNNENTKGTLFTKTLSDMLGKQGNIVRTVNIDGDEFAYEMAMNQFKDNFIVPDNTSIKTLNILISNLDAFCQKHPAYNVSLLGYPEWQTYTNTLLNSFFTFNTYAYSTYYYNALAMNTKSFEQAFTKNFGKIMAVNYPRYGMMGFDLAYYIIHDFMAEGSGEEIVQMPYQSMFRFIQDAENSGYSNRFIQLIHYTKTKQIELIR